MNHVNNLVMGMSRIRFLLVLMCVSLGLWIAFAQLVVPPVIESAYRGESWSFLNRMISGQATHPVSHYLQYWDRVTIRGFLGGLGLWLIVLVISSPPPIQRVAHFYRGVAILTLNTLVLLACFELATTGVFKIWSVLSKSTEQLVGEGNPREKVSYYASQDWAERFWHEFRLARILRYYPYVGWRRAPFKGKTINVNQDGIRLTPGADCGANSFKVFAFGGSTMWGTGSPNWGTIPANLQAGLQKLRHGPVCVVNFAETAYVSTQGLLLLIMQLQSGNVPDLVIFYEGPPDIYAAYQSGQAGVPQNLSQLAATFEGGGGQPTLATLLTSSNSYSVVEDLMGRVMAAEKPAHVEPVTYDTMGINVATLTDAIVRNFFGNYKIVSTLAQKYGFKYFFFLQPIVSMGNKPLTREEQEIKHRLEIEDALNKLCTAVYQTVDLERSKYRNFYSLAHVFDGYDSLLWIDEFHVTPTGNQLIAQKVLQVINGRSS